MQYLKSKNCKVININLWYNKKSNNKLILHNVRKNDDSRTFDSKSS